MALKLVRIGDPLCSPCDGADSTRTFSRQQSLTCLFFPAPYNVQLMKPGQSNRISFFNGLAERIQASCNKKSFYISINPAK